MNNKEKLQEATMRALQGKITEDNEKKYISERGEEAREFFNTIDFKPFFDEIRRRIGDSSIQFEEPTMGDFKWDSFKVGFVSEDLSKKCGVMSCVYEYCQIDGVGGGIAQSDEEEIYLWLPAHFSFQYTNGGSNGHTLMRSVYTKDKGWEFNDAD